MSSDDEYEDAFSTDPDPSSEKFPAPGQPLAVARQILPDFIDGRTGALTLRSWRGGWLEWTGTHWTESEEAQIRSLLYRRLDHGIYWYETKTDSGFRPWAPTKHKIGDVLDALKALTHLPEDVDSPAWLATNELDHDQDRPPAGEMVACRNGLLHVGTRRIHPLTPEFFNRVSVPFDYSPDAPKPERWLTFLHQLWDDDEESVTALQQLFGYVLSGRTDLQKILLMVGPTRSGKGTIARVLQAMIGKGHCAAPTLASLSGEFGLAPLLGKPLAVVSDARLNGNGVATVVERLLSVSGEDTLTVNRKYREQWTGKLPTRFVILSNELPRFEDAAGAIANRFIVLQMFRSFLGRENTSLTEQLYAELPGILRWALDGLDALTRVGKFTIPKSSDDVIAALADLVSPVSAFVRDCCEIGAHEVEVSALHSAWKTWCEDNAHKVTSVQVFGRDLRAVVPQLRVRRLRTDAGDRARYWTGIRLQVAPQSKIRGPSRTTPIEDPVLDGPQSAHCAANSKSVFDNGICPECGEPYDQPGFTSRCRDDHQPTKETA